MNSINLWYVTLMLMKTLLFNCSVKNTLWFRTQNLFLFLTLHLSMYLHLDRHFFSCFYYVSLKTKSITPLKYGWSGMNKLQMQASLWIHYAQMLSTNTQTLAEFQSDVLTNKTKCPFVSNHICLPFQFYMSCGYCYLSEDPWSWVCS